MPPARSRVADDSRSEASVNNGHKSTAAGGNDRRRAGNTHAGSNSSNQANPNGAHAHDGIEGMGWDDIPVSTLHSYRFAYRLDVPSSSSREYNNIVLSSGIGKRAPSAARGKARTSRATLATAVRKDFNAQPISETDVIVNFLYSVKNQDKQFRLRFAPQLKKREAAVSQ